MIVIVGAGLGGLACARKLHQSGKPFLLLEAESDPGGRVRHEIRDGFTLDRGFQVVLDSYAAVRSEVRISALQPRYFDSGALMWDSGELFHLRNPLRHLTSTSEAITSSALSWGDKIKFTKLVADTLLLSDAAFEEEIRTGSGKSTWAYLASLHFSQAAIRRFFQPFFGGVFLDESLGADSALFRFYLKKFASGSAFVPAGGVGCMPRQIAEQLPPGQIRYNTQVEGLVSSSNRVTALRLASGESIPCDQLILATEEPVTLRLLNDQKIPRASSSVWVLHFSSDISLYKNKTLVLPAGEKRLVRHFSQISNVAPEYAPAGQHLITATVLDAKGLKGSALSNAAIAEIAEVFPMAKSLKHLDTRKIDYGVLRDKPRAISHPYENLILAGDQVASSNLDAVLNSGMRAASLALGGNI